MSGPLLVQEAHEEETSQGKQPKGKARLPQMMVVGLQASKLNQKHFPMVVVTDENTTLQIKKIPQGSNNGKLQRRRRHHNHNFGRQQWSYRGSQIHGAILEQPSGTNIETWRGSKQWYKLPDDHDITCMEGNRLQGPLSQKSDNFWW